MISFFFNVCLILIDGIYLKYILLAFKCSHFLTIKMFMKVNIHYVALKKFQIAPRISRENKSPAPF